MLFPYYDLLYSTFVSHTGEKDNSDFPTKALGRSAASCPFNDPHNFYFFIFFRTLWSLKSGTDDTQPAEKDRVCAFFVLLSHSHALNHPKCAWASGFCVFLMFACLVCLRTNLYLVLFLCIAVLIILCVHVWQGQGAMSRTESQDLLSSFAFYTQYSFPTHGLAENLIFGIDMRTQFGLAEQIKGANRQMGHRKSGS